MNPQTARVASLSLAVVLTTASFGVLLSGVPVAAANEGTASVVQDGDCREVTMYGDSTESISSYYDYRSHETEDVGLYSSYGTRELQRTSESQIFVYNGSEGTSLVFIHDRLGDERGGGQINATMTGLPADGEWAVEDDDYPRRNDSFVRDGDRSDVEWYWRENRTDGGAFRGLDADGITVEAEFSDEVRGWTARDADGDHVTLSMDSSVTVRTGGCGRTPPSAALTASPDTVEPGEQVTFDASGSDGDDITEYRWDLTGDGETDRVTESATTTRAYDAAGTRTATVDVVDGDGDVATASAEVTVEEAESPPNASVAVPDAATLGETVTVDASDSAGDDIIEYRWDLTGDGTVDRTTADPTVEHGYETPGVRTVTVTVVDESGNRDDATGEVEVTDVTAPTVAVDIPDVGTVGEPLTLTANGSSDDHEVAVVDWTLGDGASATGETISHTFDEPGSYSVTVTVTDPNGNSARETVDISVGADETNETDGGSDGSDDSGSDDSAGSGSDGAGSDDGSDGSDTESGDGSGAEGGESDDGSDDSATGGENGEEQTSDEGDDNGDEDQGDADGSADSGNGAANRGGGGGQGGQSAPPTTVDTERNGDGARITVRNARPGEAVQFDPPVGGAADGTVGVELVPDERADSVSTTVTADGADDFRADSVPVAVAVSDAPDLEVREVTYTVRVDRAALDHPDHAALYRHDDGEWRRLNGTETRETTERYYFEATADEFSTVALAVRRPNVSVTDIESDGELHADEANDVTATLRNDDTTAVTEPVNVTLNGSAVASRTVTVPANGTETVSVSVTPDEVGEASVAVNGESTTVPVTPAESSGTVRDLTVNYQRVTVGTSVTVTATVANERNAALTREVTFRTGDGVVATETVTVPSGETSDVTVSLRFDRPGTREITVGDAAATVQVEEAATEETTSDEPTENAASESEGMPGFGVGAALLSVCLAVFVARRRLTA